MMDFVALLLVALGSAALTMGFLQFKTEVSKAPEKKLKKKEGKNLPPKYLVSTIKLVQLILVGCFAWYFYWAHIYEIMVWHKPVLVTLTNKNVPYYIVTALALAFTTAFKRKVVHGTAKPKQTVTSKKLKKHPPPTLLLQASQKLASWKTSSNQLALPEAADYTEEDEE